MLGLENSKEKKRSTMNLDVIISTMKRIPGLYLVAAIGRMLYSLGKYRSLRTILYYPPGHFHSPLPSPKEVRTCAELIFRNNKSLLGIELRQQDQLDLLQEFARYYKEVPFREEPDGKSRYFYSNRFFGCSDAIILYSFLRHFEPRHVIEVGSGFSSAVMLDINDEFLDKKTSFTFIEPYPHRLLGLLSADDRERYKIIEKPVQSVSPEVFQELGRDDILFVDSSHVVKIGSDVAHIIFDVLPNLKPGAIVHFHDILWPFEYPEEWILQGRAWNEAYFLRAFLQYNETFEILYFNSYMGSNFTEEVGNNLPLCMQNPGGSIWLRKRT
jgi:hypothetical protein